MYITLGKICRGSFKKQLCKITDPPGPPGLAQNYLMHHSVPLIALLGNRGCICTSPEILQSGVSNCMLCVWNAVEQVFLPTYYFLFDSLHKPQVNVHTHFLYEGYNRLGI